MGTILHPVDEAVEQSDQQAAVGALSHRRQRVSAGGLKAAIAVVAVASVFLVAFPLFRLLQRTIASGLDVFDRAKAVPGLSDAITNTLLLGAGSVVVAVFLGVILALAADRCGGRGSTLLRIVPVVPLMVPSLAAVIGWTFLLSPRVGYINLLLRKTPFFSGVDGPINIYSRFWIIAATGVSLASFVYLFVSASLRAMGPDYRDAARVHGGRPLRVTLGIIVPLLRPALVYSVITVFLLGLGQFTVPLILGAREHVHVLSTVIFELRNSVPVDYALAAVLISPIVLLGMVLLLFQRRVLRHETRFQASASPPEVRETHLPSAMVLVGYGVITVLLPILALVRTSLSHFWTGDLGLNDLTLDSFKSVMKDQGVKDALLTTLRTAGLATLILVPVGFLGALVTTGIVGTRRRSLGAVIDSAAAVPLAVPGAIYGFAMLLAFSTWPFQLYGSPWLLVLGYTTIMLPHAVRMNASALRGIKIEHWHAAQVSGLPVTTSLFRILFPMVRTGVIYASSLVFILLSHEFAVSVMVGTTHQQVAMSKLYSYWEYGQYPPVAALALIMVGFTTVLVIALFALGGRRMVSQLDEGVTT
ncbi:MAG: iron ABC transporter permease [Actinomycetota bacterium]